MAATPTSAAESPTTSGVSNNSLGRKPRLQLGNQGASAEVALYEHSVSGHHMMLQQSGCIWKATRSHREERFYVTLFGLPQGAGLQRRNSMGVMSSVQSARDDLHAIKAFVPKFFGIHSVDELPNLREVSQMLQEEAACTQQATASQSSNIPASAEKKSVDSKNQTPKGSPLPASIERPSPSLRTPESEMIVLEDLCADFKRPCVLDIKMGRRQYGVNAPAAKVKSKTEKAAKSTSDKFGVRLCGMKLWDSAASEYVSGTKHEYRFMKIDDVRNELLCRFLRDESELHQVFREKVAELLDVMQKQSLFRFFTSSLLLVYDSDSPSTTARIAMVDFAYTYTRSEMQAADDPDASMEHDEGYCRGLETLHSLLSGSLPVSNGEQ